MSTITAVRGTSRRAAFPPFVVWPVARREYYGTIWIAMLPALLWGAMVFGFRPLSALLGAVLAATLCHTLLKRVIRWKRAQGLVYAHTLVSVMVLAALAHPTWPTWVLTAAGLVIPVILTLLRGPGRGGGEIMHLSVVLVVVVQFVVLPLARREMTYAGGADAILARDRMLMGDLRSQHAASVYRWPTSLELGGDDAVQLPQPAAVAAGTFDRLSAELATRPVGDGGAGGTEVLSSAAREEVRRDLDDALGPHLPDFQLLLLGIVPGRVGTVCLVGITAAGLLLAYRFILRPQSVIIFALMYLVVMVALAFTPACVAHIGLSGLWQVWRAFPAELATLLEFLLFNSDAPFAAVFLLALPGTEPLTPRGRLVFLMLAAGIAAAVHRWYPTFPAASVALCGLMPLAEVFDRVFAKRSWLNAPRAPV